MDFTQLLKFRMLVSSAKWYTSEHLIATYKSLNMEQRRSQYKTLRHSTFDISWIWFVTIIISLMSNIICETIEGMSGTKFLSKTKLKWKNDFIFLKSFKVCYT